jgi:hypothetical protein
MDIELSTIDSAHIRDWKNNHDKRPLLVLPPSETAESILLEKESCVALPHRTTIAAENDFRDDAMSPRNGLLSTLILQEIKKHYLQTAIRQQQPCCSFRRVAAALLAILPFVVVVLDITIRSTAFSNYSNKNNHDKNCRWCILLPHWEVETAIGMVSLCGGFGAFLYSNEYWNYSLARWIGGFVSSLGSLLTIWMFSQNLSGDSNTVIALGVSLFVGILGAMPGIVVYFLAKITTDDCCATSCDMHDGLSDGYSTLTTPLITMTTVEET